MKERTTFSCPITSWKVLAGEQGAGAGDPIVISLYESNGTQFIFSNWTGKAMAEKKASGTGLYTERMGSKVVEVHRGRAASCTLLVGSDLRPRRYVLKMVQGMERCEMPLVVLP